VSEAFTGRVSNRRLTGQSVHCINDSGSHKPPFPEFFPRLPKRYSEISTSEFQWGLGWLRHSSKGGHGVEHGDKALLHLW